MKSKKSIIIACAAAVVILLVLTAFSGNEAADPSLSETAGMGDIQETFGQDETEAAEGDLAQTEAETADTADTEETAADPEEGQAEDETSAAETADGELTSAEDAIPAAALVQEDIEKEAASVSTGNGQQTADPEAATDEDAGADGEATLSAQSAADDNWILAEDELKKTYAEDIFLITVTGNTALNVREEPTTDSDWVGKMYEGSGGQVLEAGDGWTRIQSGKVTGWVSNDYILTGEEAAAVLMEEYELVFEVTSDALKVRSEPTTEADNKIRAIYGGETYEVISVQKDWVQIEYSTDKYGWVAAEYGTIHYEYDDAMTKKEYQDYVTSKNHVAVSTTTRSATSASTDDLTLLACLIQCESGSYEGMLAVANVVINRVNSSRYPNTISEVIYAAGQFSPVSSGKLDTRLSKGPSATAVQAASDALNGTNNIGSYLHFRSSKSADLTQYSAYTIVAGNVFY